MATCPYCRLQTFRVDDRYCSLCGKSLCALTFDRGLYLELPDDDAGTIEQQIVVRNTGRSMVTLLVKDQVDTAVHLRSSAQHVLSLDPYTDAALVFEIEADRLQKREIKQCYVDFQSTDPRYEKGTIRFGLSTPADVVVETRGVDLGELATSPSDQERHNHPFNVLVSNRGGQGVHITLQGGRDDVNTFPIQVAFQEGDSFDLEGYSRNVSIPLIAWTPVEQKDVKDTFFLLLHSAGWEKDKDERINLSASRCAYPPVLQVAPLVLAELVPGQSPRPGSGQTRVGEVEIHNIGGSPCRIMEVVSESDLIRLLPDQLPKEVKPKRKATIEFVLSTRASGNRIAESTKLPVNLLISTDYRPIGQISVGGTAQLSVPTQKRGLMAVDFGTINSCVAFIEDRVDARPELIRGDEKAREQFVPSMMIFVEKLQRYEDWLLHGPDIKGNRPHDHSKGVVHSVKRAIEKKEWQVYDTAYQGVQLATWIIEQLLLESGRRHNCRPERVAMTIPAAFWGPKRAAMLLACKVACQLAWGAGGMTPTPIDEATAASMYYYFDNRAAVAEKIKGKNVFLVLVFDFGGGTLDISVVEFAYDDRHVLNVQPLVARGDNHMGGIDLDLALVRALAQEARRQHEDVPETALTSSRWEFNRIYEKRSGYELLHGVRWLWYQEAKRVKEELTDKSAAEFAFAPLYDADGNELQKDGARFEFKHQVTREAFEEMVRGRVERATRLVASTLSSHSLRPQDIDVLLLTGQSSRVPCFQQAVRRMFGHLPVVSIPLKESVAAGAAWAVIEEAHGRVRLLGLTRTSYRYGIEGTWTDTGKPFVELIGLNSDFQAAKNQVTLRLGGGTSGEFRQMDIIQNGTPSDDLLPDGTNPDITVIGRVDLSGYKEPELKFSLFFSTDTGMLTAEVDGRAVEIQPVQDEASEAVYL